MEGVLRRVVWAFREQPVLAYSTTLGIAVALTGLVVRGVVALTSSRPVEDIPETDAAGVQLRNAVAAHWKRTAQSTDLTPLSTSTRMVDNEGIMFLLTVVDADTAARKPGGTSTYDGAPPLPRRDAFAALSRRHAIATLHGTHTLVFNKFYVVPRHLVAFTTSFASQEDALSAADMGVAWHLATALNGVSFYNAGLHSGASQPRRHVQFLPFAELHASIPAEARAALASAGASLPLDLLVSAHRAKRGWRGPSPGQAFSLPSLPSLPFNHTVWLVGADVARAAVADGGRVLHEWYVEALAQLRAGTGGRTPSHNLLLTPTWMLLVPRTREFALSSQRVSVNSLAYAGLLLSHPGDTGELTQTGLRAALRRCAEDAPE